MIAHSYTTDTSTYLMMALRSVLILGGGVLLATQMVNIISGSEVLYGAAVLGCYFIFVGVCFDYHYRNLELIIGKDVIRHRRFEKIIRSERNVEVRWQDIEQITVHTWSVHLTVMDDIRLKFKLPDYTYQQFQNIKQQLGSLAEEMNIAIQIKSWW